MKSETIATIGYTLAGGVMGWCLSDVTRNPKPTIVGSALGFSYGLISQNRVTEQTTTTTDEKGNKVVTVKGKKNTNAFIAGLTGFVLGKAMFPMMAFGGVCLVAMAVR